MSASPPIEAATTPKSGAREPSVVNRPENVEVKVPALAAAVVLVFAIFPILDAISSPDAAKTCLLSDKCNFRK